jgi:hypothetical protein
MISNPYKAKSFPHRTEGLRDSASVVSPIRFMTGTGAEGEAESQMTELTKSQHAAYTIAKAMIHVAMASLLLRRIAHLYVFSNGL